MNSQIVHVRFPRRFSSAQDRLICVAGLNRPSAVGLLGFNWSPPAGASTIPTFPVEDANLNPNWLDLAGRSQEAYDLQTVWGLPC